MKKYIFLSIGIFCIRLYGMDTKIGVQSSHEPRRIYAAVIAIKKQLRNASRSEKQALFEQLYDLSKRNEKRRPPSVNVQREMANVARQFGLAANIAYVNIPH